MNAIAFSVIMTGATVWAISTLTVMTLGLAAHRKDSRVVVDDPWEQPGVAARWRELELAAGDVGGATPTRQVRPTGPTRPKGPSQPRSAA